MFLLSFLYIRAQLEFANDVPTQWFTNKLDHFDVSNEQTFKQRYYYNNVNEVNGYNTAIIYIGGEGPLSSSSITGGAVMNLSASLHSALYSLEHRYFGESQPFDKLTTENLKYLTINQALADLAKFIDDVVIPNGRPNEEIRIGVVGGSYPGSLSSWFRLKYPHYAYASWASSAPVLIKNDFSEYDSYISSQLKLVSENCFAHTKEALDIIEEKLNSDRGQIIQDFGFDESEDDVSMLYSIVDALAAMVQYNSRYQLLEGHCERQNTSASYSGIVESVKKVCEIRGQTIKDFDLMMQTDEDPTGPYASGRSWSYMTCREVGWFQTAAQDETRLRSKKINLEYFRNVCTQLFGIEKLANENEMNRYFGGNNPKQTKVFFLNGDVDPWSEMGVHIGDEGLLRPAIVIPNESHCADLGAITDKDAEPLSLAKSLVINQMYSWLTEENCNGACVNGRCAVNGCVCNDGWGGEFCDVQIKSKEAFDYAIILGVSIPVVATVIIIFSVWIFYYKIKKPKKIDTRPLIPNSQI
ncbi:Clan SC, family S28, unassigned serine peptidase [Tritrichomonas foetus]|uniref:Clan SC, family S28, unassigned serine peptidase n=1 Tax=Tritrichomonas foetus TaxID=1144522 RepID=A0A1J4L018_9EUKA|nr:Clan SC, family S28, unassigned serine peptidase [Tritrichomonas foetus]|eukprot:OHT16472.1 Clan SC, family S28, unassigned serine peptidase [Tritrichomonas foetus]